MRFFTKPISRQEHLAGNYLDDTPQVLDNLRNDFNKGRPKTDLALLRKGDVVYFDKKKTIIKETLYYPQEFLELSSVIRGEAGAGKSVLLNRIIKETIDNNHKAIIHSIKGDEIKMLHGYCDFYLIEPWNKTRGYAIDFLNLVVNSDHEKEKASIRTFVNSFNKVQNGKADFFDKGATAVIEAIVRKVVTTSKTNGRCTATLEDIVNQWNDFQVQDVDTTIDPNDDLQAKSELDKNQDQLQIIKDFLTKWNKSATIYVDPSNAKTSLCVLASCIEVIRKFEVLGSFWQGRKTLDIRKWVNTKPSKDRKVIILVNSNKFADVADCYISAFINLIVSEVIEESYQVPWQLHFLLDEFPQLSSINLQEFLKLPDVGRGKGIRTKVALQRTDQIKASFNMDGDSFIGAFQNKIWCRMATSDLQSVEKELGKRDVREYTSSSNWNAQGKSISTKVTEKSINVVNVNDLQNILGPEVLKNEEGIKGVKVMFKFANNPRIAVVTMPPVQFPKRPRKKVPRAGSSAPTQKQSATSTDDSKEEMVISEMEHELEATTLPVDPTLADLAQEHQGHEHDPVSGAITETVAHAVGGEGLSAVIQASEMLEAMGGTPNENTNIVTIEEITKEGKKLSFKKQIKQEQSQQYNIDQELDL